MWCKRRRDPRIRDEIQFHVDQLIESYIAVGMSRADAERRAFLEFGNVAATEERVKDARGRWLEDLGKDIRYSLRTFSRNRGFAAVAVLSLALGLGAAIAIFSVCDAVLLRPLPYRDADRVVLISQMSGGDTSSISWLNYLDLRDRSQTFDSMSCAQPVRVGVTGLGPARRVDGRMVCANFFDVLGVRLPLGRGFRPEDDEVGAPPVVIVSDRFWRTQLQADPRALDRSITLNGRTFAVVGVLPPAFQFFRQDDVYAPIGLSLVPGSGWFSRASGFGLRAVGRLRANTSVEQASRDVDRIAADLAREYPATNAGLGGKVERVHDALVGDVRGTIIALVSAVALLLLLACVNVANLLVGRNASRQTELAIRVALGCGRLRLMRQVLVEGLMLAVAGGLCGVLVATWLLSVVVAAAPPDVPRIDEIGIGRSSLALAAIVTVACGIILAAFSAVQASRAREQETLVRSGRTAHRAARSTRRVLMAAEAAFAIVLLAGGGLMVKTMIRLNAVDPGFRPNHLLTARLLLEGEAWREPARRMAFLDDVTSRILAQPGVLNVGLTLSLPIDGSYWDGPVTVADKTMPSQGDVPTAAFVPVSPDYFDTAGMPMLRGRRFDRTDSAEAPRTAIVNDGLARRLWPREDPIGKRLRFGLPGPEKGWEGDWREVVGVVGDVRLNGITASAPPQVYLPLAQLPGDSVALVVRTSSDPAHLATAVQDTIQHIRPDVPVASLRSMDDLMRSAVAYQRLSAIILTVFAGVALVLAAVGVYGVAANAVADRTREIGLRMALGARPTSVVRLIVSEGLGTVLIGSVVGVVIAALGSRAIEHLLFEVTPYDPATFGVVVAILLLTTSLACAIPARRAVRVDPVRALRAD